MMLQERLRMISLTAIVVLASGLIAVAGKDKPRVESPYTPERTGKAAIHCQCVLGVSGCASDLFWRAAGAPVHDWWQDLHFREGHAIDLDEACYRKRDVEGQGDGLCCEVTVSDGKPDEEMLHNFFGVTEVREPE